MKPTPKPTASAWSRIVLAVAGGLIAMPLSSWSAPETPVTFNGQIAPIIYQNCSSCHRPGEAAPFSLLSYQDVVRKAKTIGKATALHLMPPWKAAPASYAYRDERRLKPGEIELIQAWVKQGMPEMGSISLIAVPHEETDLETLQGDLKRRGRELARDRMRADPALALKVARILAE